MHKQAYMREVIHILSGDKVLSEVKFEERKSALDVDSNKKKKTHKKLPPAVANIKKILMSK